VLIGFNQDVAWTHTVSQSKRLSTYILTLDPQDPTRYLYDGDYKEMTSEEYTVEVKNDDGSFSNVTKTLYSSHYGPMIGWNPNNTALTYRDANVGNTNIVSQWLAINKATSVADIESSIELYQGIPWVNVIATDKEANAYFIDASKAPNLTAQADAIVKQYVTLDPTGKASSYLMVVIQYLNGRTAVKRLLLALFPLIRHQKLLVKIMSIMRIVAIG